MQQAQLDLLVLEAQNGNTKAFECLFEYFHPQLLSFANNLSGNPALAKDAVQDVWISISRRLRTLNDPRAFKGWIFRALRWRVLDLVKAKSNQYQEINEEDASEALDESEIQKRELKRAIDSLSKRERTVVYLFYMAELSVSEVALVLEIPSGTVKSRLSAARSSLQKLL